MLLILDTEQWTTHWHEVVIDNYKNENNDENKTKEIWTESQPDKIKESAVKRNKWNFKQQKGEKNHLSTNYSVLLFNSHHSIYPQCAEVLMDVIALACSTEYYHS